MLELKSANQMLSKADWAPLLDAWIAEKHLSGKSCCLLPPDFSRSNSFAGEITQYLFEQLSVHGDVQVMPAVGTHAQMSDKEKQAFFGSIPSSAFLEHRWQSDCTELGTLDAALVDRLTDHIYAADISIQLNRLLAGGNFNSLISIGQVVPHEVVGMANYTKNLLVGLGGKDMINHTHMLGALYGIEKTLGQTDTPVRRIFDYVQKHYSNRLEITYILTVTDSAKSELKGIFIGQERDVFEHAALFSQDINIIHLPQKAKKVVAWLDPNKVHSTWIGNKAVYRTRMAIADGGELLVIAPGVSSFGENRLADEGIRKYGYSGTERILSLYRKGVFQGAEMVAAHLLHGSSEGRFQIRYATNPLLLRAEEIRSVGYEWMDVKEAEAIYTPSVRETGPGRTDEMEFYFVKSPALGLWMG